MHAYKEKMVNQQINHLKFIFKVNQNMAGSTAVVQNTQSAKKQYLKGIPGNKPTLKFQNKFQNIVKNVNYTEIRDKRITLLTVLNDVTILHVLVLMSSIQESHYIVNWIND